MSSKLLWFASGTAEVHKHRAAPVYAIRLTTLLHNLTVFASATALQIAGFHIKAKSDAYLEKVIMYVYVDFQNKKAKSSLGYLIWDLGTLPGVVTQTLCSLNQL